MLCLQVWDRLILYYGASQPEGFSDQSLDPHFAGLLERIKNDSFSIPREHWPGCGFEIEKGDLCAKAWAEDSHALVCNEVYSHSVSNSTDLMKDGYAKEMVPVVELQLAKAAWRMAGWLNALVDDGHDEKFSSEQQKVLGG